MHGAYNAIPRDFDKDGDLDIAAISFFPDFKENGKERELPRLLNWLDSKRPHFRT